MKNIMERGRNIRAGVKKSFYHERTDGKEENMALLSLREKLQR
jgi:hypothetical protein